MFYQIMTLNMELNLSDKYKSLMNMGYYFLIVTQSLPQSCSDAYPKIEGFYQTKPSLDVVPTTLYCSYGVVTG